MGFLIGLMTFILVVNCLVLMLLILIQLPKKDAGAGTAFGSGATDALFGAGTGNALTKMTKYAATIFFVLSISLSILNVRAQHKVDSGLLEEIKKQAAKPGPGSAGLPATPAPMAGSNPLGSLMISTNPSPTPAAAPASSNKLATPPPAKPGK